MGTMKAIVNAKTVHAKADIHSVQTITDRLFVVTSGSSRERYYVRLNDDGHSAQCDCDWGTSGGRTKLRTGRGGARFKEASACSHVQAVFEHLEAEKSRRTSAWSNAEDAARQHRPIIGLGDGVLLTSRLTA